MGEYYDFEIQMIDGREVFGFCFKNEGTGWNEIFVEMTEEQRMKAREITDKYNAVREEQDALIQSWIKGGSDD